MQGVLNLICVSNILLIFIACACSVSVALSRSDKFLLTLSVFGGGGQVHQQLGTMSNPAQLFCGKVCQCASNLAQCHTIWGDVHDRMLMNNLRIS